jgi:hypothetical protein
VVGAIAVQTTNGAFSGTLSVTGAAAAKYSISSGNLVVAAALSAGSDNINIVATQAGATGSPRTQAFTITVQTALVYEIFRTQGPLLTPAQVGTLYGTDGSTYESDMVTWGDFHFAKLVELGYDPYHWRGYPTVSDAAGGQGGGIYYEGATIDYCLYARTQQSRFLTRANARALKALEGEWHPDSGYAVGGMIWYNPRDVYLYHKATGDARALDVLNYWAQWSRHDAFWVDLHNTGILTALGDGSPNYNDDRTQAKVLDCLLYAHLSDAVPAEVPDTWGDWIVTTDFAATLEEALPRVLSSFHPTKHAPAFTNVPSEAAGFVKPFMLGMLMSSLIDYYELYEADTRIPPAVKGIVDYVQDTCYVPGTVVGPYGDNVTNGLKYLEGDPDTVPGYTGSEGASNGLGDWPYSDLNGFFIDGVAFVYKQTSDITYRQFALDLAHGLVLSQAIGQEWMVGIPGMKQYNQRYTRQRFWGYLNG